MIDSVKGVPVDQIITKYKELGNVWKVGEFFSIPGQTIHSKLKSLGIINKMNVFSQGDIEILKEKYPSYKKECRLQELADELGRTKQFICRKAKELGLTGRVEHYDLSTKKREELSKSAKERIRKYGHPRGALGMKHTDESKLKMSEMSKRNWETHREEWCSEERRKQRSDSMMKSYENGLLGVRSRCYLLDVSAGGKNFLAKSSWEYDVALYLEHLKRRGLIQDWGYETRVFQFAYNSLGVRSYRPDFTVFRNETEYYIEVKGWVDEKSEIKKRLMSEEFPDVKVLFIGEKEYKRLDKKYSGKLEGWGTMKAKAGKEESKCSVEGCDSPVHSHGLCRHHFYQVYHK